MSTKDHDRRACGDQAARGASPELDTANRLIDLQSLTRQSQVAIDSAAKSSLELDAPPSVRDAIRMLESPIGDATAPSTPAPAERKGARRLFTGALVLGALVVGIGFGSLRAAAPPGGASLSPELRPEPIRAAAEATHALAIEQRPVAPSNEPAPSGPSAPLPSPPFATSTTPQVPSPGRAMPASPRLVSADAGLAAPSSSSREASPADAGTSPRAATSEAATPPEATEADAPAPSVSAAPPPDEPSPSEAPAVGPKSLSAAIAESVGAAQGSAEAEASSRGEAPPFDRAAALAALRSVLGSLQACSASRETGRGRVTIVFDPSGAVSSVTLDSALSGTAAGNCVVKLFRSARVPAFSGSPMTVNRSFELR